MAVLLYAPEVQLVVATDDGFYDVSGDIVSGSVTLTENQSHQMQCVLLNKGRRYDKIFKPNDRFALYLKRLQKLLVMTGYLDTVPFFSVWPRSITISGSSTLKRLQYHFWDPNLPASVNLFDTTGNSAGGSNSDQNIVQKATALLTQVGNWNQSQIHFSSLPTDWVTKVAVLWESIAPSIGLSPAAALGTMPFINGTGPFTSGVTTTSLINPAASFQVNGQPLPGSALPANFGTATNYQGGQDVQRLSSWYAQMQWGYENPSGGPIGSQVNPSAVRAALRGAKLMVGNPDSNTAAIVEIAGWGPPAGANAVIGLSPDVLSALKIKVDPSGAVTADNQVEIAWVLSPGQVNTGVYNAPTQNSTSVPVSPPPPTTKGATPPPNGSLPLQYNNSPQQGSFLRGQGIGPTQAESPEAIKAVAYAIAQANAHKPYAWGGAGPNAFDCSGLVMTAWAQAGVTLPHNTVAMQQVTAALPADPTYWLPGDLLFYNDHSTAQQPGHVMMYIGNNQTVQAPHSGATVFVSALDMTDFMGATRVTKANVGTGTAIPGSAAAQAQNNATAIANANSYATASDQVVPGNLASLAQIVASGSSFDSVWTWMANAPAPLDTALTGYRALMNDTPLLPMIQTVVQASMRSFCSAPNGDFIAWFPDYFNVYGQLGVVQIQDIELQDFTVMWSDLNMVTHQYTAGTFNPNSYGPTISAAVSDFNMLTTGGVATIDFPQILQELFNLNPNDPTFSTEGIYNRFGARPNFQSLGTLFGPVAEFWYALYLFQQNWAGQFSASVPICFMPELYPGMIMQIPKQGFQCYVQQVEHTWNLAEGGGFTTQVNIAAPSAINNAGLYGFAKGSTSAA